MPKPKGKWCRGSIDCVACFQRTCCALLDLYEGPRALTDQIWLDDKNVLAARLILNNIAE
jgi:hypothetical protein